MATLQEYLVFADIESAYGVDPTIVATDALLCSGLTQNAINGGFVERANYRGGIYGSRPQVPVNRHQMTQFVCELAGTSEIVTPIPPPIAKLFRMCGFLETLNPATDVTLTVQGNTALHESGWIEAFSGVTRKHVYPGARGNVTISIPENNFPTATFSMMGRYIAPADGAGVLTPDTTLWLPPTPVSEAFTTTATLDGAAQEFVSADIDMGNNVVSFDRPNVGENIRITDNPATGTLVLKDEGVATNNWAQRAMDQDIMDLVIAQQNPAVGAGWRWTMTARIQLTGYELGDSNEDVTENMSFAVVGDATNNPLQFVFDLAV